MKTVRHIALMLAVLLPLLSPAMACALPNVNLSAAERACCEQMKGDCGGMDMPASHGCCHKEVPTAAHRGAAVEMKAASARVDVRVLLVLTVAIVVPVPATLPNLVRWHRSRLPHSPPPKITVLRI